MEKVSTHDTRALARYNVAQAIVGADNSREILMAFAELIGEYDRMSRTRLETGDKDSALRWARVCEELTTLVMCASINLEESGR